MGLAPGGQLGPRWRPQAAPGGLEFYDLPLTSPVSPLQLWASQWSPWAFSIANVNALEADAGTTPAVKGWGNGLAMSLERDYELYGFSWAGSCGWKQRRNSLLLSFATRSPKDREKGKMGVPLGVRVEERYQVTACARRESSGPQVLRNGDLGS